MATWKDFKENGNPFPAFFDLAQSLRTCHMNYTYLYRGLFSVVAMKNYFDGSVLLTTSLGYLAQSDLKRAGSAACFAAVLGSVGYACSWVSNKMKFSGED